MEPNIDELLQKAEKLRSELDGNVDLPRIERNLKQLAEVGKELWSRTAYSTSRDSCDIRASVLLGSQGYDLQKVSQHLESLSANKKVPILENPKQTYDIQSFLKYERENAVLSVIEEVKKFTYETVDNNFWNLMDKDWDDYKHKILNSMFMEDDSNSEFGFMDSKDIEKIKMTIDSKKPVNTNNESSDVEYIINQIVSNKDKKDFEDEINIIYNSRDNHNKAIELLNNYLSSIVSEKKTEGSKRERLEIITLNLAEKFCNEGHNADKEIIGIMYLLLDLMTFFDYYNNEAFNDAFDTIQKLNILPFRNVDIKLKINQFAQFSEKIRRNIPEILIGTMNILYEQYKEARASTSQPTSKFGLFSETSNEDKICNEIRQKAKTLITYAGMIPYRMPGDTSAKLVQLEVLMN